MEYLDKQIIMILKPPSRGSMLRKPPVDITDSSAPHIVNFLPHSHYQKNK